MATFTEDFAGTGAMSASWAHASHLARDTNLGKTIGAMNGTVADAVPYVTTAFGQEQYAQIVVQSASWSDWACGPMVRFSDLYIDTYYCLSFSGTRIFIVRQDSGGSVLVADTGTTVSIGAGTAIKITATTSGANAIVKAYIDGTEVLSYTDTAPYTGSNIGIAGYYVSHDIRYATFEGGDLSSGVTATGLLASISLTAPTSTATGAAAATGAIRDIALIAPTASASVSGEGSATGALASIQLTPPTATATGAASATGSLRVITLTAPTATAVGSVAGSGTITLLLTNNTGTLLASETGATVYAYATSGDHVVTKTGQTTNGSGVMTITDPLIVAATQYRVVVVLASGDEGLDKATAV